jgi:hypothetical protein
LREKGSVKREEELLLPRFTRFTLYASRFTLLRENGKDSLD